MKNKKIVLLMLAALSIFALSACTKGSKENEGSTNKIVQSQPEKANQDKADNTSKTDSQASTKDAKEDKSAQEATAAKPVNNAAKIEGKRKEFIGKLDNIQKQLDALPVKKDSDAGVTNAMRSYYGKSYEEYDKALNEIYALLKKQLSQETMKKLQAEQVKWIVQKEADAKKAAEKYKGGTFEFVANYSSLYESTKKRCYELVNQYMTD